MADVGNRLIENAQVMFRNFAGMQKQFNDEGKRNFVVILDPEMAAEMEAEGWNVKTLRPREEGDEPKRYVQVDVNYSKGRPPRVVLVSSRGRIDLGADEVSILDYADVKNWDVLLNPFPWDVNGNKGIKAYLKTLFVTINEDELDLKYADVPDAQVPTGNLPSATASDD